ncbi:hypothetical protein EF906_32605, partial [Streptomyces sp. WAC08241]
AARAGLLAPHLDRLVTEAEAFLAPSPAHPWYAGAVLLAGRGGSPRAYGADSRTRPVRVRGGFPYAYGRGTRTGRAPVRGVVAAAEGQEPAPV